MATTTRRIIGRRRRTTSRRCHQRQRRGFSVVWLLVLHFLVLLSLSRRVTEAANAQNVPQPDMGIDKVLPECLANYDNHDENGGIDAPMECLARQEEQRDEAPESSCGLYLAKSTIPGAGLGVFTGVAKKVGDTIGLGGSSNDIAGDGCIPLVDFQWHNAQFESSQQASTQRRHRPLDVFSDYAWLGASMGMHEESSRGDIEAMCPGLDCAINCHLGLNNVGKSFPIYDDGSYVVNEKEERPSSSTSSSINQNDNNRATNPGAGAYSPYWNITSYVIRDIPAGGELFKAYGDRWFVLRQHVFGNIPLTNDYVEATQLLSRLTDLMFSSSIITDHGPSETELVEHIMARDLYETVIIPIKRQYDSRTLNALPDAWTDAVAAIQAKDVTVVLQPYHTEHLEYLQTEGVCLDHITAGQSQLPHAGHGAFAHRPLSAGAIITASPLLHVMSRDTMNMHNFTTKTTTAAEHTASSMQSKRQQRQRQIESQDWVRLLDEVEHTQLMLNYCYGHPDSSLLLCPYGSGVNYMNHNRTLQNVRIEWAAPALEPATGHNTTAVSLGSMHDLASSSKPQLAFQYVAMRDIQQGEELYLDYGLDWEDAWLEHAAKYPQLSAQSQSVGFGPTNMYVSAHFWNWEFRDVPIRTERQQQMDPYPDHLQIRCHRTLLMRPPPPMFRSTTTDDEDDGDSEKENNPPLVVYKWLDKDYGLPCRILDRFSEDMRWDDDDDDDDETDDTPLRLELYTIQLEYMASSAETDKTVVWVERTDVPRSAIRFFDVPSTTDMHQPFAFRHYIGIPDEIFPSQWRNLQDEDDDDDDE